MAGAAITLTYQNSYLSRTRSGLVLRRALVGHLGEPQPALRQRPLTANPDDSPVTGGVISPDGKYLAYADSTGLYLRQVEGGETHAVPLPKDFDAFPESWFPDSVHLVVSRLEPGKGPASLWVTSLMGGTPRMLTDVGSYARVSPDGSEIVFLRGMWDNEEIWLMRADGNNARRLVDGGADQFGPIAWAPDGKRFASVRTTNPFGPNQPGRRIEVYEVASGHGEAILQNNRSDHDVWTNRGLGDNVAWTIDGRLVYSLQEPEPNQADSNLWALQLAPHTGRPSGPPTRITNDRTSTGRISITSDGKRMALLRGTDQADVHLAEWEARGERLSALRRFTLDARFDIPSAWTPDSQAVLFISNRDGQAHIFKQKIDQTQPELLVGGTDIQLSPRLTPDGASALYGVSGKPGDPPANIRILRVPLSGGPSQFVVESQGINNLWCARLPSTVCIYSQVEPEGVRFFTFDAAGGKATEILAGKVKKEYGRPAWTLSPDGKYIVLKTSENPYSDGPTPRLRIVRLADGADEVIPINDMGLIMGMDWAPDSKSVWVGGFMGRSARGTRSGLVNVTLTGKQTTVLKATNPTILAAIPSPDGRHLALWGSTNSANLWLLENF